MAFLEGKEKNSFVILPANFTSPSLHALIETHTAYTTDPAKNVPGDECYVLTLDELMKPDVWLFCCWDISNLRLGGEPRKALLDSRQAEEQGATLVGCAALRVYKPSDYSHPVKQPETLEGEVKSMHTLASYRGKGLGRMLIDRLVKEAKARGLKTLRLETGATEDFNAAKLFYEKCGFQKSGVFAAYKAQQNSLFMERTLTAE